MDSTVAGCYLGIASALVVVIGIVFQTGKFGGEHLVTLGSAFLSSFNILPPWHLAIFILNDASRKTLPAGLVGYEKYIVLAAICSFAMTLMTLGSLFKKAWLVRA